MLVSISFWAAAPRNLTRKSSLALFTLPEVGIRQSGERDEAANPRRLRPQQDLTLQLTRAGCQLLS